MTPAYVSLLHSPRTLAPRSSIAPRSSPFLKAAHLSNIFVKLSSLPSAAASSTSLPTMLQWTVTRHLDFRKQWPSQNNDHSDPCWRSVMMQTDANDEPHPGTSASYTSTWLTVRKEVRVVLLRHKLLFKTILLHKHKLYACYLRICMFCFFVYISIYYIIILRFPPPYQCQLL